MQEGANDFYRLPRGTFAQHRYPLDRTEQVINSVLEHSRDERYFAPGVEDACNVLDVIHPLWLAGWQSNWRTAEAAALAEEQSTQALHQWQAGACMGFAARTHGADAEAGVPDGRCRPWCRTRVLLLTPTENGAISAN